MNPRELIAFRQQHDQDIGGVVISQNPGVFRPITDTAVILVQTSDPNEDRG